MAGTFSTLRTELADGVFTITLHRPEALNAISADMSVELGAALRLAQRDPAVRCLVLTGAGRAFCAGQDVRALQATGGPTPADHFGAYLREAYNPLVLRIRTGDKPVIAAINGPAAGAGLSLALAADLRLCAASATLKLAFTQLGLVPDAGATLALLQHVGFGRAAEICLLDEPIPAARALELGLVNRVVEDVALAAATRTIAGRLAALPPRALTLVRRALNHAWTAGLEEQLEYEAFLQTTAGRTADHREAVAAFLGKRPPHFTGQ
ncbi:MAG: enoyl-CoA hydratase-related protein [Planctomycetota bacterium]